MSLGERLGGGLAALMGVGMLVLCLIDLFVQPMPPASWLTGWQVAAIGGYYPQLTLILLVSLAVAPGAIIAAWSRSAREKADAERLAEVSPKLNQKPFERRTEDR
ncbi:MAG: hypothetical protein K2W96_16995 [Gemmataceae bacterium]|nr:hypothetical protein [Gemmataceae bacterium]